MAKEVWRDGYIQVNGVDLSDHCSAITVEGTTEDIDVTSFTTAGFREFQTGFKDATITATFFQDFAASSGTASVDNTLQPLWDGGGTFSVHVKAHQTAAGHGEPALLDRHRPAVLVQPDDRRRRRPHVVRRGVPQRRHRRTDEGHVRVAVGTT